MEDSYLKKFVEYCADGQFFEAAIQGIYECFVRSGDTVVDAGANRGRHTFPLCDAVGPQGRVYAIEAIPGLARELAKAASRISQLSVVEAALTNFSGQTSFHYVKNADWFSGIGKCSYPFEPKIEVIEVPARRLDELIPEEQVISFIKLDLEGGEYDALQGSKRILERDRPLVVFEHAGLYRSVCYKYEMQEFELFWSKLDYRLVDLFGRSVSAGRLEQWPVWYLVATADERSRTLADNLHVAAILAAQRFQRENCPLVLSNPVNETRPAWAGPGEGTIRDQVNLEEMNQRRDSTSSSKLAPRLKRTDFRSKDTAMRIVIGCEHNVPPELLRDALTVGKALMARGHVVSYVVGDPITLVDYAGSWTPNELYQAPLHRSPPDLVMKRPVTDGFSDRMATVGFDEKQTLLALSSLWYRQIEALKPDVIIGFYSPVLWLVGPAHAPTFALGAGLTLPPALGTSFPRLSIDSTPLADESMMLENANAALLRLGQPSMAALSEMMDRCEPILYGVPACDPYLQVRRTLSIGLLGIEPNPTVPPQEQRLAALLDINCPGIETIVLALAGFDNIPVDICISGVTSNMRRFLEEQPHIRVWKDYSTLLQHVASMSVVVHHGALDVAQRCISVGRPQLLVPWTREQEIFGATTQWMACHWIKHPTASIDEMAQTFRLIANDLSLTVAAQHHARQLANTNLPDALPEITERIEATRRVRLVATAG